MLEHVFKATTVLSLVFLLAGPSAAQDSPEETTPEESAAAEENWELIGLLEGTWEGKIEGILGQGEAVRRYERILDGKFLMSRHASVRAPQPKSPKGDYHRELTVFSFDSQRGKWVHREFMVEGYVVRSLCETDANQVVCTSEEVESGPGIQARLTLEIADRFRFREVYELAFPGREMKVFFTNDWHRVPDLRD